MKADRNIIMSIFWMLIGITLFVLGITEHIDEFWSSMGSAFFTVGILQLLRFHRLKNNDDYRERMEIQSTDERLHFIRSKAWAWAGYLFILISSIGVIAFKLIGQNLLSQAAAWSVCLMLILFYGSYMVLRKKY